MMEDKSKEVIGAAIEVHKLLGPGLLESTYEECLAYELTLRKIPFERQKELPVFYKEVRIDSSFRADFIVDNHLIVELKSVEGLLPIHYAQILTYMKIANCPVGLLLNFNVKMMKDGIRRFIL